MAARRLMRVLRQKTYASRHEVRRRITAFNGWAAAGRDRRMRLELDERDGDTLEADVKGVPERESML
jgi:hypothetical protein